MKIHRLTIGLATILLLSGNLILAQENRPWWSGSAYTLPQGRWEIGLFQPLRYGQTDRLEWSTHPVLNLVIPNLTVKLAHGDKAGWVVASRHSLRYPTPLLRLVAREGIGGILAPDPDIEKFPPTLFWRSEVLLTRAVAERTFLTAKGGLAVVPKAGDIDSRSTIDLPVIFPRMAAMRQGFQLSLGLDGLVGLTDRLHIWTDGDLFLTPGLDEALGFEHKGLLVFNKSQRFQLTLGYKLTFGNYPYGDQWHLLPLFDLQWARQR